MSDILGLVSITVTVVYAWLTFRILKANHRTVAAQEQQLAQDRLLRVRDQFLTGMTTVMQCDLASPGCTQSLHLAELLAGYATRADGVMRQELCALLRCAISQAMAAIIQSTPEVYPNLTQLLSAEHAEVMTPWLAGPAREQQ